MQQPAADNSFHSVPGPSRSTVPTADVHRRRAKEYALAWWFFFIWVLLAVAGLAVVAELLFGGWSSLLKLVAIARPPFVELLLFLIASGGAGAYVGYSMVRGVDELFRIRAFQKLYRVCPYVDPVRLAQYRLAHLLLQRPSRFTYAFSGTKLVVAIHNVGAQGPPQDPSVVVAIEKKEATGVHAHAPDAAVLERNHYFLVDIHQSVSLSIVEETSANSPEDTRRVEVEVPLHGNLYYLALVARLAIRGEEGVERVRFMTDLYAKRFADKKQMEQSIYDDMRRIRERVKRCVEKSFPVAASQADQLRLFERREKTWYLSGNCRVRGGEALNTWYRRIKAMRQGTDTRVLAEDRLAAIASLLLKDYSQRYLDICADEEAYSGGYLLEHLREDPFASWAPGFFVECRTRFIYVMTYIAECKHRMGVSRQEPRYFNTAARYYKECAYAATCSPVDQDQGEKALRSCVEMYMSAQDVDSAEGVLNVYAKRMGRIVSGWEPAAATRAVVRRYNLLYD